MAKKYLDNVGLDHAWDKIKTYLTSKYAAKSHTHTIAQIVDLQTTLNGKANKATTLAGYGITNAYTKTEADNKFGKISNTYYQKTDSMSSNTTYTIPAMAVGQIHGIYIDRAVSSEHPRYIYIKTPSGGRYLVLRTGRTYAGNTQIEADGGLSGEHVQFGDSVLRIR